MSGSSSIHNARHCCSSFLTGFDALGLTPAAAFCNISSLLPARVILTCCPTARLCSCVCPPSPHAWCCIQYPLLCAGAATAAATTAAAVAAAVATAPPAGSLPAAPSTARPPWRPCSPATRPPSSAPPAAHAAREHPPGCARARATSCTRSRQR